MFLFTVGNDKYLISADNPVTAIEILQQFFKDNPSLSAPYTWQQLWKRGNNIYSF